MNEPFPANPVDLPIDDDWRITLHNEVHARPAAEVHLAAAAPARGDDRR